MYIFYNAKEKRVGSVFCFKQTQYMNGFTNKLRVDYWQNAST